VWRMKRKKPVSNDAKPNRRSLPGPRSGAKLTEGHQVALDAHLSEVREKEEQRRQRWIADSLTRVDAKIRDSAATVAALNRQFDRQLEKSIKVARSAFLRKHGVEDSDRRQHILRLLSDMMRYWPRGTTQRPPPKGVTKMENRLADELADSSLSLEQIRSAIEAIWALPEVPGVYSFELFERLAPHPVPPPQPKGPLSGGEIVDFEGESKKRSSKVDIPPVTPEVVEDKKIDNIDRELDLLPAQFRQMRDIQPAAFVRLKTEIDDLVPIKSLKLPPADLPAVAPKLWKDRQPRDIDFVKWLHDEDGWGPFLEAGLLNQAALSRLDPAAHMAFRDYESRNPKEAAELLSKKFVRGVGDQVRELILEGRVEEARKLVSRSHFAKIKKEMAGRLDAG